MTLKVISKSRCANRKPPTTGASMPQACQHMLVHVAALVYKCSGTTKVRKELKQGLYMPRIQPNKNKILKDEINNKFALMVWVWKKIKTDPQSNR